MDEKKNICPYCGKDMLMDDDVCPYCGKKLLIRGSRLKKVLSILLVLGILGFVLSVSLDLGDFDRLMSLREPEYIQEIRQEYPELNHRQAEAMIELKWFVENQGGGWYSMETYLESCGFRSKDASTTVAALESAGEIDWLQQAVMCAERELEYGNYSRTLLVDQLQVMEGFDQELVETALDSMDINWTETALVMAQRYLEYEALSYTGLRNRMENDMFPEEEIQYALENLETDWNQNALDMAQTYLSFEGWTREEIYDTLINTDGFTPEQAQYAVENSDFPEE